ncbi:MAG: hypothetical protein D6675_09520 [Gemmatimonadetes bacterium]|nr:MAG: hypothetical protein D6675_09520 [Gemmatimonadota bacterium]
MGMFPGRNSVVERADGEKIQIQTQLHEDWDPVVVRTEVIIKGQVKIDKRTEEINGVPIAEMLKDKAQQKTVNQWIWQQHQKIYMSIKKRVDAENAKDAPETPIEETVAEVEEDVKKEDSGFFGKVLGGLFGKKK